MNGEQIWKHTGECYLLVISRTWLFIFPSHVLRLLTLALSQEYQAFSLKVTVSRPSLGQKWPLWGENTLLSLHIVFPAATLPAKNWWALVYVTQNCGAVWLVQRLNPVASHDCGLGPIPSINMFVVTRLDRWIFFGYSSYYFQ